VILAEMAFVLLTLIVTGAATFLDAKGINSDTGARTLIQTYPALFQEISLLNLSFAVILFLFAGVQMYFYSVILRAFGYLRKVCNYPPPLSVGWSHRV
jgi:hypothetical protein